MNRTLFNSLTFLTLILGLVLPWMTGCGEDRPPQYNPPIENPDDKTGKGGGFDGTQY